MAQIKMSNQIQFFERTRETSLHKVPWWFFRADQGVKVDEGEWKVGQIGGYDMDP